MGPFYDLSIKRQKGEVLIESEAEYDQWKLRRGVFTPAEPFKMKKSEGSRFYDIAGFQDASNFAISARLYMLLIENTFTGWKGYRINIKGQDEEYYGFQVTGQCGKLVESAVPGFYNGYKFDHNSWDGSDFFSPGETALLFCIQKVRDLLVKEKISNVELTDIEKVRHYSVGES